MPTIAEAIAKAPQDVQPALFDLADALRTDRIVDHIDLNVTRLDAALERLAEAQRRTEARLEELAQAQARLTEAQRRTEARVEELAQAQSRTERAVQELARQVGGLSDTIGFTIEEMGRLRVHDYLERRGYHVDTMDRRLFTTARGELEFDLYAEGTSDGSAVVVIGEVKSRISEREARLFLDKLPAVAGQLPADRRLLPVLFGFAIHPAARTLLQEHNGFAIESYQR